ncbi:MAG TPA: isochorismatase family cysteine hydrolase [Rhodanobacteraceae bacterium]|nr:isochorismatase family cysteine hydrolase [Rhodanobacteraceae bacterium]
MKPASTTLRGDRTTTALLLIDLINTWGMADGRKLLNQTLAILPQLVRLKARAATAHAPVIYVNDNFGQWRSDFKQVVARARGATTGAARVVEALCPGSDDYFILKPRHSGFFSTPLDLLLQELNISRLVLCGVAGDQCVLATASDALVRKYEVVVPRDTIACAEASRTAAVLKHFRVVMDIPVVDSARVRWR